MNQIPKRIPINDGGRAYIILCYAKTKKTWFTTADYREFQLNRKPILRQVDEAFRQLTRTGCLEKTGDRETAKYRITLYGQHVLQLTGQARKKKELDEMKARMTAAGAKSAFTTESRLLDKLKRNGGDPVI